jgi:hypothetical protein
MAVPSIEAWVEALWLIAEARAGRSEAQVAGWGEPLPA